MKGPMSCQARFFKRFFDFIGALIGLLLVWWVILIAFVLATLDTRRIGFFTQQRVGKGGKLFRVIKIRTMRDLPDIETTITRENDPRITRLGRVWRKMKIDELPQLWNVLVGDMSFVGPRPDMPEYAARLEGEDRLILKLRPGITGPASLKYANEEELLAAQPDPQNYNDVVLWPDKVRINLDYYHNRSFFGDIALIFRTVFR